MLQFRIDEERCIQCGECALECPAGVIAMDAYPEMTNEAGCAHVRDAGTACRILVGKCVCQARVCIAWRYLRAINSRKPYN